jgi:hypothetical protein
VLKWCRSLPFGSEFAQISPKPVSEIQRSKFHRKIQEILIQKIEGMLKYSESNFPVENAQDQSFILVNHGQLGF